LAKAREKKQSVSDVMTTMPIVLPADAPISAAARAMRDRDIGGVIVQTNDQICGMVTDRDVVVRAIATGKDPSKTPLVDICSQELTTVTESTPVDEAVQLMRDKAIRRLPVIDDGHPVGILSIGDLAIERDRKSALADVSGAPANR